MITPVVSLLALFSIFLLEVSGCGAPQKAQEALPATADEAAWRVLGPGGGGAQYLPTINPVDPDNVFERCDMTGAYVTLDGGKSWRMYNLRSVVQDFEFDPRNPNTIYASNNGLYRSEDRGGHWSLVYQDPKNVLSERMLGDHAEESFETSDGMPDGPIQKIRVDPENSDRIFLGLATRFRINAAEGPLRSGRACKLLVSTDRGASFRKLADLEGREIFAILPGAWDGKPQEVTVVTDRSLFRVSLETGGADSLALPAGTVLYAEGGRGAKGSLLYVMLEMQALPGGGVSGGIYRSTDRGASWKPVNTGLLEDFSKTGRPSRFRTLAVCEGQAEVAYLSCAYYFAEVNGQPQRQFGIFKTENSGERWDWVYRAGNDSLIGTDFKGGWMLSEYGPEWGEYPLSLGVSPTSPNICYATDFGCSYRTLDGGKSWEQVYSNSLPDSSWATRGLDVTTCYGVHFDPFDPAHLFISYTDIGAFHSFNGGKSWLHSIKGVPRDWHNTCYWMVFDPAVKDRAWSVWGSGHDLPRPKMFRDGNFDRFVGGVAVSGDGCRSWSAANAGMPDNTVCTHILLDPDSPADSRTLYVCGFGKGLFRSTDGGRTWENKSAGVGPNLNVWRLVRLPSGKLLLLVARGLENRQVVDGALYASTDKAESWRKVSLPEGVNAPNDLVYDPSDPQRMYLSCWPYTVEGRERFGGLWRTDDGGVSWQMVFREDAHVYAAALDPANPSTVFINTFDSAAFRSDDMGKSWRRLKGYTFKWGHRPIPDPHHPAMLYLTTFGGSVFYGPAAGVPEGTEDIVNFKDSWRWGE